MRKQWKGLIAGVSVAGVGALLAGCGTTTVDKPHSNAAASPFNGRSRPAYSAAGGPANPPGGGPAHQAGPSSTATPGTAQLRASLLGVEDLPYTAVAYPTTKLSSPAGCITSIATGPGSTAQAGEAFYQSPSAAPGGNAYPASAAGGPNQPLRLAEMLEAFPSNQAKAAFAKVTTTLDSCGGFTVDLNGSPVKVSAVKPSGSAKFGSPSTGFTADVTYKGAHLHAVAAIGVVGDVMGMVAYMTTASPDSTVLGQYLTKARDDITTHIHS